MQKKNFVDMLARRSRRHSSRSDWISHPGTWLRETKKSAALCQSPSHQTGLARIGSPMGAILAPTTTGVLAHRCHCPATGLQKLSPFLRGFGYEN